MSVLIKGMEMPTSCYYCPFTVLKNGRRAYCPFCHVEYSNPSNEPDGRLANCPLVPVPPHGRLGDLDALKVSLVFAEKTAEWAVPTLRAVLMVIDEMPTIIPESEDGE